MGRRLLLVLLLAFVLIGQARATDYSWRIVQDSSHIYTGISPQVAFEAYVNGNWPGWAYEVTGTTWLSEASVRYTFRNRAPSSSNWTNSGLTIKVDRVGDSCPSGYTYDSTTGECKAPEPDKCESTKGVVIYHAQKIADIQDGHLTNYNEPPGSMCSGSCTYNSPAMFADAYRFKSGDPAGVWQNYSYLGTGESCTASTSTPEPSTPSERNPTGEKTNKCTDRVTDAEGRVHYTCTASESQTQPGNLKCATGESGKTVCVSGKPSPSQKTTETKTEVTETANADGSSTTNTTTTTTVTSCTGADACTTTTTVNNSTSGTKTDGTPGDTSSSCSGPGCQEGESDDGEDEEDQPERTASGDTDCDAPLACDGDAIDCAVLRQQKQLRCEVKDQGDFPKHKDEVKGLISGSQFAQEEDGQVEAPSFLNQGSRFLPATCPTAKSFSLKTNGGRTFQLSYEPLCAAASDLGILFVIGTSVFCALYVGRAFGGE